MSLAIIVFCFFSFFLYKAYQSRPKKKLSSKIKSFIKKNPDDNITNLAAAIANQPEFNMIPFNVAEEYCFLIKDGRSVNTLDEEYGTNNPELQ